MEDSMKTSVACGGLVILLMFATVSLSAPRWLRLRNPFSSRQSYESRDFGIIVEGQYEIVNPHNTPIKFSLSRDGKTWKNYELKPNSNETYRGINMIRFCDNPGDSKSVRKYSLGNSDRYVFTFGEGHYDFKILKPRK
jgi:hypothetical protein